MEKQSYIKLWKSNRDKSIESEADIYDVMRYDYAFEKSATPNGQVTDDTKGGVIQIETPVYPSDNVLAWVFDSIKRMDGEVMLCDGEMNMEHLVFEEARCIDFHFTYDEEQEESLMTHLTIHAMLLKVADSSFTQL